MKYKRALGIIMAAFALLFVCLPAALSAENADEPSRVAVDFLKALRDGDETAYMLVDDISLWIQQNPPLITVMAVYASMEDIAVTDVQPQGDDYRVTLQVSTVDLEAAIYDEGYLPEEAMAISELLYETNKNGIMNLYATLDDISGREAYSVMRSFEKLLPLMPRRTFEVPFIVCENEWGQWCIALSESIALWPDGDTQVRARSWQGISQEYAAARYYAPEENWNVWLRLEASGTPDRLYGFILEESENTGCAQMPVHYVDRGMLMLERRFAPIDGM